MGSFEQFWRKMSMKEWAGGKLVAEVIGFYECLLIGTDPVDVVEFLTPFP
jgi:hypothetical protein